MTFGQRVSLNVPPLLLRLGLAFVFIYYGAGKLFYEDMPVRGESAAWLANHGFIDEAKLPPVGGPPADTPTRMPEEADEGTAPAEAPADEPEPTDERGDGNGNGDGVDGDAGDAGTQTRTMRDASAGFAMVLAQQEGGVEPAGDGDGDGADAAPADGATERYSPADFGEPVEVSRRLALVLMMRGAAEAGDWPVQLASPTVLGLLSWMAALTEFFGGWLVLLGFLTRLWALGLAGTMFVAMWLTQLAPAIGSDTAYLGFLPELQLSDPAVWTQAWKTLHFQLILMLAALAVFFSGPGMASLDAVLFRRSVRRGRRAGGGEARTPE